MKTIRNFLTIAVLAAVSCSLPAGAFGQNCASQAGCQTGGCNAGGCQGGCGGCKSHCGEPIQCPNCANFCKVEVETIKEKKTCWDVECKLICITKVTLSWQKCCAPKCAKMKFVRVLKQEEYECEHCQYKFTPVCDEDCQVPFTHGSHGCGHGCGRAGCTGCNSAAGGGTGAGCALGPVMNLAPAQNSAPPSAFHQKGAVVPPPPIVVENVLSRK